MLYNFKTVSDDQQWVVNVEELTWARASNILASASVKAAENQLARFMSAEEGPLAPMGGGAYRMVGRKPLVDGKPSIQVFAILRVPITDEDGQIVEMVLLQANVDTKDFKGQEIKRYKYECMPAARATNPAQQPIAQPPITVEEKKAATPAEEIVDASGAQVTVIDPESEQGKAMAEAVKNIK